MCVNAATTAVFVRTAKGAQAATLPASATVPTPDTMIPAGAEILFLEDQKAYPVFLIYCVLPQQMELTHLMLEKSISITRRKYITKLTVRYGT